MEAKLRELPLKFQVAIYYIYLSWEAAFFIEKRYKIVKPPMQDPSS